MMLRGLNETMHKKCLAWPLAHSSSSVKCYWLLVLIIAGQSTWSVDLVTRGWLVLPWIGGTVWILAVWELAAWSVVVAGEPGTEGVDRQGSSRELNQCVHVSFRLKVWNLSGNCEAACSWAGANVAAHRWDFSFLWETLLWLLRPFNWLNEVHPRLSRIISLF